MKCIQVLMVFTALVAVAQAYPNGSPLCDVSPESLLAMNTGGSYAMGLEVSAGTQIIKLSVTSQTPSVTESIKIALTPAAAYTGLLLYVSDFQGFKAGTLEIPTPILNTPPLFKHPAQCSGMLDTSSVLTHTSSLSKSIASFVWMPPTNLDPASNHRFMVTGILVTEQGWQVLQKVEFQIGGGVEDSSTRLRKRGFEEFGVAPTRTVEGNQHGGWNEDDASFLGGGCESIRPTKTQWMRNKRLGSRLQAIQENFQQIRRARAVETAKAENHSRIQTPYSAVHDAAGSKEPESSKRHKTDRRKSPRTRYEHIVASMKDTSRCHRCSTTLHHHHVHHQHFRTGKKASLNATPTIPPSTSFQVDWKRSKHTRVTADGGASTTAPVRVTGTFEKNQRATLTGSVDEQEKDEDGDWTMTIASWQVPRQ